MLRYLIRSLYAPRISKPAPTNIAAPMIDPPIIPASFESDIYTILLEFIHMIDIYALRVPLFARCIRRVRRAPPFTGGVFELVGGFNLL